MELKYSYMTIKTGNNSFYSGEHQFWVVQSGNGQISFQAETIFLLSQDILEIPAEKNFHFSCNAPVQIEKIEIRDFETRNQDFRRMSSTGNETLRRVLSFAMEFRGFSDNTARRIWHHVDQMVYEALLFSGLEEYKLNKELKKAIETMNAHVLDPDFNPAEVIAASGYSQSYFHRLFREETGLSPTGFLQKQRMELAKSLLRQANQISVKEAAQQCGYADPYYFSRLFKKWTGLSPSSYAESMRKKDGETTTPDGAKISEIGRTIP